MATGDSRRVQDDDRTDAERCSFLVDVPGRLGAAVGGAELRAALDVEVPGVTTRVDTQSVWVGGRQLRSSLPSLQLELDPAVDARWLSERWRIDAPVAVSGDVHQRRWHLQVAGGELPDPIHPRIVSSRLTAGRWEIDVVLAERPSGPPPAVVSGASPAYDLLTVAATVVSLSVERAWVAADVVASDHPTVVVGDRDTPLAVAGFRVERGALWAHSFSTSPGAAERHAGSALIDALEAIALDEGVDLVRLDRSVVAVRSVVPFERHGYHLVVAAADASASRGADGGDGVVAERRLDV